MSDKPRWLKPHGTPWTSLSERLIYDTPWLRVTEHAAVAPTGRPATYGRVGFKNRAIAVVPLHADGTLTLVGQNRFPFGRYSWEIPEGGVPYDEDPLDGAKRELAEEVGLAAADWRQILSLELSNSITDEHAYGYLALDLTPVDVAPDDTEDLAVARVPFGEALTAVTAGWITDVLTVALLLRVHHMAVTGALPASLAKHVLD